MTTSNLVAFGQVLAATSTLSSELASDGLESEPSSDSAPMDVTSAFRHLGYRRTRTFPVLPTEKKPQPEASFKPFELVNIAAFNAGTQNHFQDGGQGRHITRAKARNVAISETRSAVLIRLAAIRREAQIESMSYSYDSEQDLRVFVVDGLKPTTRPAISLLENGNLRAHWRNSNSEQAGFQFLGQGWAQYVLFSRASNSGTMRSSTGRTEIERMPDLIRATKLWNLVTA